jgi:hypothetical protein
MKIEELVFDTLYFRRRVPDTCFQVNLAGQELGRKRGGPETGGPETGTGTFTRAECCLLPSDACPLGLAPIARAT